MSSVEGVDGGIGYGVRGITRIGGYGVTGYMYTYQENRISKQHTRPSPP
jgi:hypothetical protein